MIMRILKKTEGILASINVKNRMQVLYGGQAAVSIRNEVQGAVVMIRIPRMNKDENTEL